MNLEFLFEPDSVVETPFREKGIVRYAAWDGHEKVYLVAVAGGQSDWYREVELKLWEYSRGGE